MATVEQRSNTDREDDYKVKKKALEMLPDAEANILKLQVGHCELVQEASCYLCASGIDCDLSYK